MGRSVRIPPLTEETSPNVTGYASVAGRKARIPAKVRRSHLRKSPPLGKTPPFFRQSTQRVTKGSGWVEPRDCARARKEGPASPMKAKAKFLMMSFLIENPQRTGRELTDRKQVLKS